MISSMACQKQSKILLKMYNILYISYYYPPSNAIGATRSANQVNVLRRLGHNVKVFYAENNDSKFIKQRNFSQHDDDYLVLKNINKSQLDKSFFSFIKSLIFKFFPISLISFIASLRMVIFSEVKSWNSNDTFLKVINKINFKPDVIISTCSPIENHSLAAKLKIYFSCTWLAEYRDPWSLPTMLVPDNPYTITARIMRLKERRIINSCDLIISASPFISEYYEKFFKLRSFLAASGWTDDYTIYSKPKIVSNDTLKKNILHLGSMLHGRRSPEELFNLFDNDKEVRDLFNLYFVGRDAELFRSSLNKTKYAKKSVFLHDEIERSQARSEGMAADILLILMMNQPNEKHSLVGKIYEYIYLQKPIIVYEKYKSETSKLVLKYDLGFSVNSENELGNLLKNFDKRKGYINLSDQTREHFNLKNCMIKLCKEIELIKRLDIND